MNDNVAATQEIFRIWNTREFDALIPLVTEDIEWAPATMAAVEGGGFRGTEELRRFFDEWDKAWAKWEVEPSEVREHGDSVLILGRVHAEGRGSGMVLDQDVGYVFRFRNGLLAWGATYFDQDEARAAAREGVREEGATA